MKQFFAGIRPQAKRGDMWFQIYIGFDEEEEDVKGNLDWWYEQHNGALFKKHLQVQRSVCKFWLLFSHEKINIPALFNEINVWAARDIGITIPIALLQSAVKDGKSWKDRTKNGNDRPIKALLIDVQEEHVPQAKQIFSTLYGSSVTSFPLQMKLRYVPCIENNTPSQLKAQIQRLRCHQQWFHASIGHAQSWDFAIMDTLITPNKTTLRSAIMTITAKNGENNLFLGINGDQRGDGKFLTFPLTLKSEARDMVSQLAFYLVYKYNTNILKYFTSSAANRALALPWDNEMYCAKSPELEGVGNLLSEVNNTLTYIQEPRQRVTINSNVKILNDAANKNRRVATFRFSQDTGLVATFCTHKNGATTGTRTERQDTTTNNTMSDVSSKGTNGTLSTRVSTMENNLQSLQAMLSKVHGLICLTHNANNSHTCNDQARQPKLNVVTPPATLVAGGSAL